MAAQLDKGRGRRGVARGGGRGEKPLQDSCPARARPRRCGGARAQRLRRVRGAAEAGGRAASAPQQQEEEKKKRQGPGTRSSAPEVREGGALRFPFGKKGAREEKLVGGEERGVGKGSH